MDEADVMDEVDEMDEADVVDEVDSFPVQGSWFLVESLKSNV